MHIERATLDDWLNAITVRGPADGYDAPGDFAGWYIVLGPNGPLALLPTFMGAYRFRLDYINRKLNEE